MADNGEMAAVNRAAVAARKMAKDAQAILDLNEALGHISDLHQLAQEKERLALEAKRRLDNTNKLVEKAEERLDNVRKAASAATEQGRKALEEASAAAKSARSAAEAYADEIRHNAEREAGELVEKATLAADRENERREAIKELADAEEARLAKLKKALADATRTALEEESADAHA